MSHYQHHRQTLENASTVAVCDHLIEAAFFDYIRGRLTDEEYSRLYYAAESKGYALKNCRRYINQSNV